MNSNVWEVTVERERDAYTDLAGGDGEDGWLKGHREILQARVGVSLRCG